MSTRLAAQRTWPLPAWLEVGSPQAARVVHWMLGSRFVDLPIRVLVLHAAVTGFGASSPDNSEFVYLLLHYLSCVLIVAAAFVPRSAAVVSLWLFLVFLALYPQLPNPFDTPVAIGAAVLLSLGQWRWWLLFLALIAGEYWVLVSADPTHVHVLAQAQASWAQNALLAVTAFLLEARIRRETDLRRESAAQSEREVLQLRLGVAADVQDSIAHCLTAQDAIVRRLAVERDRDTTARMLGELALETGRAQAQLGGLLERLRDPRSPDAFAAQDSTELLRRLNEMRSVAGAAGIELSMHVGELPKQIPAREAEQAQFMLGELLANLAQHGSAPVTSALGIGSVVEDGRRWLVIESRTPVESRRASAPRQLVKRAESLGGSCTAVCADGEYRVTVKLPLRGETRPDERREPVAGGGSLTG
ncbi:hypothetical protein [Leucobacter triazinivorans]|uniref:Signal transduction histidine kinase subgroup 3 dimerisation and phosphoacceptor domain-containing protein n=1 Tax=Leucobacter triazinivorans TaxID=1784719 RepID=A0A4P6KCX0_9MICO|nr:hypothetical protein [Leucobacter triazinivorans]QBE47993.1 hypothetical protein EVS81_03415 [Leucobacter triazinivorans]